MSSSPDSCVGSSLAEPEGMPEEAPVAFAPLCTSTDNDTDLEDAVAHFRKEEKERDEMSSGVGDFGEVSDDNSDAGDTSEEVSMVDDLVDDSDSGGTKEVMSVVKAQEPFQPGSTPIERTKGYLAYNLVGYIEVTDLGTHHVVNVEFNNRSIRMAYHFRDEFRHNLASVFH